MSILKEIPAWFRTTSQFRELEAHERSQADSERQKLLAELEAVKKDALAARAEHEGLCTAAREAFKKAQEALQAAFDKARLAEHDASQYSKHFTRRTGGLEFKLVALTPVELVEFLQWLADGIDANQNSLHRWTEAVPSVHLNVRGFFEDNGFSVKTTVDDRDLVQARSKAFSQAIDEARSLQTIFLSPEGLTQRLGQIRRKLEHALAKIG